MKQLKRKVSNKIENCLIGFWCFCWVVTISLFSVWLLGKALLAVINLIGGVIA